MRHSTARRQRLARKGIVDLALIAFLLAHANGLLFRQRLHKDVPPTPSGVRQAAGLLFAFLVTLLLDRRRVLTYRLGPAHFAARELPLRRRWRQLVSQQLPAWLGQGTATGVLLALPPILFFLRPVVLARPVEHPTYTDLTWRSWLRLILIDIPFLTALPEEAAFRGALEPRLAAQLGPWRGVALANAVFGLGHFAVTRANAGIVGNGALLPRWLLIAGGMTAAGLGGVVFSLVRASTGSLVGAIAAHWAVNATMSTALFLRGRLRRRP